MHLFMSSKFGQWISDTLSEICYVTWNVQAYKSSTVLQEYFWDQRRKWSSNFDEM